MSLRDAKRLLQWKVVLEAMSAAGVDADTIEMVEHARAISDVVMMMSQALIGLSDVKQAKNYVKVEMIGLLPPFDRIYVEVHRPGGATSHELRGLLRDRLVHVRRMLAEGTPTDGLRDGLIQGIDEDLAKEAP